MSKSYFESRADLESQLHRLQEMKENPLTTPDLLAKIIETEVRVKNLIEIVKTKIDLITEQGISTDQNIDEISLN